MLRILAVDDEWAIRALYHDILSEEGHEVYLQSSPTLDLDQVEQRAPDLIILGYLFEHKPAGLDMIHQLSTRPTTAHIPVILCTAGVNLLAAVQPDLERRGIHVLPKPFAIDDLLAVVAHALTPRAQEVGGQ